MWTPYDTINASLLLLDDPPYDAAVVASLLDDLRIYRDERQEIYQRAILAEHRLHFSEAEIVRLRALMAETVQADLDDDPHELSIALTKMDAYLSDCEYREKHAREMNAMQE